MSTPDRLGQSTEEFAPGAVAAGTLTLDGDRYVLLEALGRGGTAVVYTAYDRKLDRKIAIKLLSGDGRGSQTRLLREAQALAKLRHPNVVTVYDVALALESVAAIMAVDDRTADSLPLLDRAIAISTAALGAEHPLTTRRRNERVDILTHLGRQQDALDEIDRVIALDEKNAPHAADLGEAWCTRALVLLELARPHDAVAAASRASELFTALAAPRWMAKGDFVLAQAMWEERRDRRRAVALAGAARDGYAALGAAAATDLADVQHWLREHVAP